jgi:hypothetical protein
MATTALSKIIREAKAIKRKHPHKYDSKGNSWTDGFMVEAGKKYREGTIGKKKKKVAKKKVAKKRRKPVTRKKKSKKAKPVYRTVYRAPKKRRKRATAKRKKRVGAKKPVKTTTTRSTVRTVGRRGRSVGKKDKTMLLLGVGALVLGGIYLLNKSKTPTYPTGTLPAIATTSNVTRNTQSQDIVNYAIAGGLALDAITKLIQSLNSSNDSQVDSYYKQLNTTGQLDTGLWA